MKNLGAYKAFKGNLMKNFLNSDPGDMDHVLEFHNKE